MNAYELMYPGKTACTAGSIVARAYLVVRTVSSRKCAKIINTELTNRNVRISKLIILLLGFTQQFRSVGKGAKNGNDQCRYDQANFKF